ncbi:MAG: type III polyketide synthase [Lentisphaerae bacterium]|nr:type III polyketide synthase [Lentisphaerota bacterium]
MDPRIVAVRTLLPDHAYTAREAMDAYDRWVSGRPRPFREKARRIFEAAAIDEKHTVAPADVIFSRRTLEETNRLYSEKAVELGGRLLAGTLEQAGWAPADLDLLVTTSCTGHMIPSLDAHLVNRLGLRSDIRRMPITHIGCAGGAAGMIYALDFLRAYPGRRAALLSVEFPSNTIQLDDFSWDNIIGTAIFGDGLGCVLMGDGPSSAPLIRDAEMRQVPDSTDILGYRLTGTGFLMNLDRSVPQVIEDHFDAIVGPFLRRNGTDIESLARVLVHPGGVKILDKLEAILAPRGQRLDLSRAVMKRHGNMSSGTIHFILEAYLRAPVRPGRALVMSYGPGFTAHQLLLEWE